MADRFIWYELMTSDADSAIAFYTDVVGWTAEDHPGSTPDGHRYTILSAPDGPIGGVMQLTDDMLAGGARPGWLGYVGVADADAAADAVSAAGGSVLMPPADIPGVGRFAMVADPGGAPFYLMKPMPAGDVQPPPEPHARGTVGWHELYSAIGQERAFAFYSALFGWETLEEMDMGPMGTYRIFGADGVPMGGMMDKPANVPASAWGFYVHVEALDAAADRISSGGGKLLMGPMEVPGGSWVLQAADPQGAAFALTSNRR